MIVLRLTRVGKTKDASFRIVVQDKRRDPWGKALDYVGTYNPRSNPKSIKLDEPKIKDWLSKGAKASPSVHNLLVDAKILKAEKLSATFKHKEEKKAA